MPSVASMDQDSLKALDDVNPGDTIFVGVNGGGVTCTYMGMMRLRRRDTAEVARVLNAEYNGEAICWKTSQIEKLRIKRRVASR